MTTDIAAHTVRVAVTQFASTTNVAENLATCLRILDEAATANPDLVVLPEFCNHLSVYDSPEHCWDVALDLGGPWIRSIVDKATEIDALVTLAVTLRRDDRRVTISNLMIAPSAGVIATADKQVLMGNERTYLTAGQAESPLIPSPIGPIAMYSCMEGVVFEPPMSLALRGARLLTNSLNSFGLDEAALHIPVRAAENRVFIAAANKVGPLIPAERVDAFAQAMGIPAELLDGAGESQIVDPNGKILVKAPRTGEAVVWADLDLSEAEDKQSATGVDLQSSRRPELYGNLGSKDNDRHPVGSPDPVVATALTDATVDAIEAALVAAGGGDALVVCPELTNLDTEDPVAAIQRILGDHPRAIVVTSVRDGDRHLGLAIDANGVVGSQAQTHASPRLPWASDLGRSLDPVDTRFGRLAIIVGDDVLRPELFRLAAIDGASIVACPTHIVDPWLVHLGLPERAAENRINVVAASQGRDALGSVIASLPPDFTLWLPDRQRPFDGTINTPDVVAAVDGFARATIVPERAKNRLVSAGTDLVGGRPVAGAGRSVAGLHGEMSDN